MAAASNERDYLPNESGEWPPNVMAKAEKMMGKTDDVRNMFNLPACETVVQDYYCSLEQTINHGGRMWITLNYVCFYSGLPFQITEHFPFRMVVDIQQNPGLILSNSIDIFLKDGKVVHFHSFMQVEETLAVLNHIWKFPPSYLRLDPDDEEDEIGVSTGGSSWGKKSEIAASSSSLFDSTNGNGQKSYDVNVAGSKRAVALAEEGRDKGIDILAELDSQSEKLDSIEAMADNVHAGLDRGDRQIRGIAGVGGATMNLFTRDKTKNRKQKVIEREHLAREKWIGECAALQLDILLKLESDSLIEAAICFSADRFCVKEMTTNKTIAQCIWGYDTVKCIVLRARPLHMDIRFKDPAQPRFRMMTSNIQAVTNEICIRCRRIKNTPTVLFEPNARPFDYNSFFLTLEVVRLSNGTVTKTVARKAGGTADLLSSEVDEKTRKKVKKAEENMEMVNSIATDLEKIGDVMGETLESHTDQLERIADKTHHANERLQTQVQQVREINRKL